VITSSLSAGRRGGAAGNNRHLVRTAHDHLLDHKGDIRATSIHEPPRAAADWLPSRGCSVTAEPKAAASVARPARRRSSTPGYPPCESTVPLEGGVGRRWRTRDAHVVTQAVEWDGVRSGQHRGALLDRPHRPDRRLADRVSIHRRVTVPRHRDTTECSPKGARLRNEDRQRVTRSRRRCGTERHAGHV